MMSDVGGACPFIPELLLNTILKHVLKPYDNRDLRSFVSVSCDKSYRAKQPLSIKTLTLEFLMRV